jgi:light-harvesting protein B-800-850 alpha chain
MLGSVAVTALIVHACVMTHTTWMSNYWQGSAKPKVAMENASPPIAAKDSKAAFSMMVTPVPATAPNGQASFMITVTPNSAATIDAKASADDSPTAPSAVPIRSASVN